MSTVYEKLRHHLDSLPGGFPATENGVEIRILKRLFTPEEAEIAPFVGMKLEPAEAIARKAGMDTDKVDALLHSMARRGLIFSIETVGRPHVFMAAQFVVGIWEYHVNDLDKDFVKDMQEYSPVLFREAFGPLPQLRTIPVGKSIQAGMEVLPHEQAEELVRKQSKFLVAPCICRREHELSGGGCQKLMDGCLVFGWGADYYERNGLGRLITLEETLEILRKADEEGLVLQPGNSRDIVNICLCCGDCCQVLKNLKLYPAPGDLSSSPFRVELDEEACIGCGTCPDRCQMDALEMQGEKAALKPERCIGCGLCVSTCPTEALKLIRKPLDMQPEVPKNQIEAFILRGKLRAQAKAGLNDKLERLKKI
ncbi:MAG: 4Fe-4S binding protein [Syntrophobacteraceae bacterium]|nr:4Fe-4S binding protein [Syntrophobacteraceae bacterium]